MFYNLIDSALRLGEKLTTVRFSLEKHNDNMVIICEDDGMGIPPEIKGRMFIAEWGRTMASACSCPVRYCPSKVSALGGVGARRGARFMMTLPKKEIRGWEG